MPFSYTLFFALILLFPGLCAWAGLRTVERTDLLTPRPDKPNSTATLFVVVLGAIAGHLAGAATFAIQARWCEWSGLCASVAFDPNVYREVFSSAHGARSITDMAIFAWLLELALVGLAAGAMTWWAARTDWVKNRWDAIDFGWLNAAVREVKAGQAVILAYVVSKTSEQGSSVAYQGIVQQLAMDEDQTITMLVLRQVDRFLVRITPGGLERIDHVPARPPIAQLQLHLTEFANVALEVIELPGGEP